MICGVHKVVLTVEDQEVAGQFWVEKLGFTVAVDAPYSETERWLEVASPDGNVTLVLSPRHPEQPRQVGIPADLPTSNAFFYSDDVEATHRELSSRGVAFPHEPVRQPWGWWSMFCDPDGNRYALSEK